MRKPVSLANQEHELILPELTSRRPPWLAGLVVSAIMAAIIHTWVFAFRYILTRGRCLPPTHSPQEQVKVRVGFSTNHVRLNRRAAPYSVYRSE